MAYYKIIQNNKIIGIVDNFSFRYLNTINNMILSTNIQKACFAEYKSILYHDSWMLDIPNSFKCYQFALIKEIDQEEYNVLLQALRENTIVDDKSEPEPLEPIVDYHNDNDTTSLDFVKNSKISQLSYICNKTIENGFDVELLDGVHHFSLTTQDQLNLITLSTMVAQGLEQIPYHADGELCKFYTPSDIHLIIEGATNFKTYHTTYFNALKNYVNSLDDIHQIAEIQYGIELPEEYQSEVLKALNV